MTKKDLSVSDLVAIIGLPLATVGTVAAVFGVWRGHGRDRPHHPDQELPAGATSSTLSPSPNQQGDLEAGLLPATNASASSRTDIDPSSAVAADSPPAIVLDVLPSITVNPSSGPMTDMPDSPAVPAAVYDPQSPPARYQQDDNITSGPSSANGPDIPVTA
ncbi:hypothetical protein TWF696_005011 [Orbilia brochopaga]|uniref:Uncharacterized protein n=1 Tax=Orbilia brochopaga TaxID=3140254 RepID=A0AAV9V1S1_9PEZI